MSVINPTSSVSISGNVFNGNEARGFNAAMRVRNAVWQPPFVMFYLTFLLPRARVLLEAAGLRVEVRRGVLPAPYERYALVIAHKPG